MEIKLIDERRLNIYLTKEETESNKVDFGGIENIKDLKERFGGIFEATEDYYGFCLENSPLEIEVIPIVGGGLFIGVSKRESEEYAPLHYVFSDFEYLMQAISNLYLYVSESDLYYYEKQFHIVIRCNLSLRQEIQNIMDEFGRRSYELEEHNVKISVLEEHGKKICEQNCINFLKNKLFKERTQK